jgi:hypothetical protein
VLSRATEIKTAFSPIFEFTPHCDWPRALPPVKNERRSAKVEIHVCREKIGGTSCQSAFYVPTQDGDGSMSTWRNLLRQKSRAL